MAELAADTFTRSDNADLGADWAPVTGMSSLQISSNGACASAAGADSNEIYTSGSFPADQWVEVIIEALSANQRCGPLLRGDAGGSGDLLLFEVSNSNVWSWKHVSGVWSNPAQYNGGGGSPGVTLYGEWVGSTVRALLNGVQVLNFTDGTIATGRPGMTAFVDGGHAVTGARIASWRAGDFSTGGLSAAVNQATETDTAQTIGKRKAKAVGLPVETDAAQAVTRRKARAVGQATEVETAQTIGRRKVRAIGQALETDTAQAIAQLGELVVAVGQATETSTAQAIGRRKAATVAQAVETDQAQAINEQKKRAIGQAVETDAAQAVGRRKVRAIGQAVETDSALPVSQPGQLSVAVGQAVETDTAQPISWAPKRRLVGQVGETDQAQAITVLKRKVLGIPIDVSLAQAIARRKAKTVEQAIESQLAQAISWAPKRRLVGQAVESDEAFAVSTSLGDRLRNIVEGALRVTSRLDRALRASPRVDRDGKV